ncbi:MAG: hypothetical protein KBT67_04005 [bacterium]|nr:hypothetical protein [Candidatus Limimorpha caballi]
MNSNCNIFGFPKQLTIIKDCHWNHNDYTVVSNSVEERGVRLNAKAMGWHVAVTHRNNIPAQEMAVA